MNKILAIILTGFLAMPFSAYAEDVNKGSMVGTSALLLGAGVTNIHYQGALTKKSAFTLSYANIDGSFGGDTLKLSTFGVSYKYYFSEYASGGYIDGGITQINVDATTQDSGPLSASGSIPKIVGGYETTIGDNFVVGFEAGFGAGNGWGILAINTSFRF